MLIKEGMMIPDAAEQAAKINRAQIGQTELRNKRPDFGLLLVEAEQRDTELQKLIADAETALTDANTLTRLGSARMQDFYRVNDQVFERKLQIRRDVLEGQE